MRERSTATAGFTGKLDSRGTLNCPRIRHPWCQPSWWARDNAVAMMVVVVDYSTKIKDSGSLGAKPNLVVARISRGDTRVRTARQFLRLLGSCPRSAREGLWSFRPGWTVFFWVKVSDAAIFEITIHWMPHYVLRCHK